MIFKIILLSLIILNIVGMSVSAFLGKKNLLLVLAVFEAMLGVLFAVLASNS